MSVAKIETTECFAQFIKTPLLSVVHFSAEWAEQCKQVSDVLQELLKLPEIQSSGSRFGVCDAESLSEISLQYKIDSVPTVVLFKNGSQVDRVDGADAAQISSKVKIQCLGKAAPIQAPPVKLEDRLKALINRHNVMVFMKEVRQGLKEYSDWPTYPQLYVKGELVGGLDIIKELEANEMINKVRTAGDGMESDESVTETKKLIEIKADTKRKESLLPGRLIQVFPSSIIRNEKRKSINAKTPKFVPYEPYTAAVKPMTPKVPVKGVRKSKNNMDINTLISQMSQMNTDLNEFKPRSKLTSSSDKLEVNPETNSSENLELHKKVDNLSKENESLKDQLKQQVQVNKELKTMLVASMGEDLEIQVQSLNEDKKHLADALLSSAQHFLMVEELAECKNLLNTKAETLHQAIKQLLDERCRVRDMLLCTYSNLYTLHEKWLENIAISEYGSKVYNRPIGNLNFSATSPHSTNIIDLASVNVKLSDNISSSLEKQDISHVNSLPVFTDGEKNAENVMATPLNVNRLNEAPVNALVHHAYNNSSNNVRPVASCVHCNGKVQLL
ncbi:Glutaredoxin [Operophtera brumata]|uniref:Glutaredoxin n=1 Tax=Operophtera brumata TaxID=104452 RepID=A0A0L7LBG6_OPEBR|nr:Glutaredoxin [Operophtera brumata]